jgi:hypothetical protein
MPAADTAPVPRQLGWSTRARRFLDSRSRVLAGIAVLLLVIGVLVAVVNPFAGKASGGAGVVDNGTQTGLVTVMRRSLTAQTPVSGTLGYAGSWSVAVPAATSATDLQQAEQEEISARASYAVARATATADEQALAAARAALRDASDQTATADQATVATAQQKVAVDRAQLAGARSTLASALHALGSARSAASLYGGSASYTMLSAAGDVVRRGQPLYAIDGSPTLLLYGTTPAWRTFATGCRPVVTSRS